MRDVDPAVDEDQLLVLRAEPTEELPVELGDTADELRVADLVLERAAVPEEISRVTGEAERYA